MCAEENQNHQGVDLKSLIYVLSNHFLGAIHTFPLTWKSLCRNLLGLWNFLTAEARYSYCYFEFFFFLCAIKPSEKVINYLLKLPKL